MHALSSMIHNIRIQGVTQVSINRQMDKYLRCVYIHSETLFNSKKECHSDICYNMNEPWKPYAKWNKPDTKEQILYGSSYVKHLE